ncbi:sigma-70 family RNA polymerase sigma factor [Thiospirillum jenense]|uniref:Sigma-70 family RNA polymerase sigma factor n=1 Tax=Thiospirillum jenense TaxID=1653858 RepID=A0A839HB05_9GAMM|nr:sigma-70 family RNA polymerase sigma factor [Thiospirillum jenense]MBB1126213.1 sigma-70 family RNA polymerase sigma factor [Thiospirillum jenense]
MIQSPPLCLLTAWSTQAPSLQRYLRHRLSEPADVEDVLHDTFINALQQGRGFCAIQQPRAWLFQITRNLLVDRQRQRRPMLPLFDELPDIFNHQRPPVDDLAHCLPTVFTQLSTADQFALTFCDLEGHPQQLLAERLGLSLSAVKSRIQRARVRLKQQLIRQCGVRFDTSGRVCCFNQSVFCAVITPPYYTN